ncbi:MAG: hypothetical protein DRP87_10755, partial [Spirochaetes bacterium]
MKRNEFVKDRISSMRKEERPREKLLSLGASSLSDVELLAIIVGSGIRDNNVNAIAGELLALLDRLNGQVKPEELVGIRGMGVVKAVQIIAALEFARRRFNPGTTKIIYPADILPIVAHYADRKQEHFLAVSLNGAHEVIALRVVSVGLVNRTIVHPREVYADPITDRAAAILVAHN